MDELVKVVEDLQDHVLLRELHGRVVAVRARVDDPVHVEVEVVHGRRSVDPDRLAQEGVPLAQPSEELGNP